MSRSLFVGLFGVLGGLELLLDADEDEDEDDDESRGRFVPLFFPLFFCFSFAGEGEQPRHILHLIPLAFSPCSMFTTSCRTLSSISSSTRSMYVSSSSCASHFLSQFLTMLSVLYPCVFNTETGKYFPFFLLTS